MSENPNDFVARLERNARLALNESRRLRTIDGAAAAELETFAELFWQSAFIIGAMRSAELVLTLGPPAMSAEGLTKVPT